MLVRAIQLCTNLMEETSVEANVGTCIGTLSVTQRWSKDTELR